MQKKKKTKKNVLKGKSVHLRTFGMRDIHCGDILWIELMVKHFLALTVCIIDGLTTFEKSAHHAFTVIIIVINHMRSTGRLQILKPEPKTGVSDLHFQGHCNYTTLFRIRLWSQQCGQKITYLWTVASNVFFRIPGKYISRRIQGGFDKKKHTYSNKLIDE